MFLFELLVFSIIYLVMIGLDVVAFFVVVHVLTLRWPTRQLLALDRVGEPISDPLIEAVTRAIPSNWSGREERRKHIAAATTLLVVALCRLALAGLVT
jgi:uncharacterized protein YggT (Ycf19 family)